MGGRLNRLRRGLSRVQLGVLCQFRYVGYLPLPETEVLTLADLGCQVVAVGPSNVFSEASWVDAPRQLRLFGAGARDASFDIAGRGSYQGDVLSLPLPYVRCLLSRSRMCLGRHCRGHPVHVSQVGGCPHMCPWVMPHAPSFGRQLWGLPSRVEYLSPQAGIAPASLRYDRLTLVA